MSDKLQPEPALTVELPPGKYVLAVSGGVDSMVLLALLAGRPGLDLVVAHFDHGIRPDSAEDAKLVGQAARAYGLPFFVEQGHLGAKASEATARRARYDFLRQVKTQTGATAIVTAHHQDDLLETALLNLRRGTGRRGLTSLRSRDDILRPLLKYTKQQLKSEALKLGLSWREDTTNRDTKYARNQIRHLLQTTPDNDAARRQLLQLIARQEPLNQVLDDQLEQLLAQAADSQGLNRQLFISLPHQVAKELLATWLRSKGLADFDRFGLERLTVQAKTKPVGKCLDVKNGYYICIEANHLRLDHPRSAKRN